MSSKKNRILFPVEINCWYKTLNNEDLYQVRFRSAGLYEVVSYYNSCVLVSGSLNDCRRFISNNCFDHDSFIQRMVNKYGN